MLGLHSHVDVREVSQEGRCDNCARSERVTALLSESTVNNNRVLLISWVRLGRVVRGSGCCCLVDSISVAEEEWWCNCTFSLDWTFFLRLPLSQMCTCTIQLCMYTS